jgi:hypothetical protein
VDLGRESEKIVKTDPTQAGRRSDVNVAADNLHKKTLDNWKRIKKITFQGSFEFSEFPECFSSSFGGNNFHAQVVRHLLS